MTAPQQSADDRRECVFRRILASRCSDKESLIVHRGERNFIILNRYPYISGHMMVIPYEHVGALGEASAETTDEMMRLTCRLEQLLQVLYRPEGVNIGMNIGRAAGAGIDGHIHMHALPRWVADANFATVIGETRVLPESLSLTWERAREEFERLPA